MFLTSYKQHTPPWRNTMSRPLYWSEMSPQRRSADYVQQIRASLCNDVKRNPKTQGQWSTAPRSPYGSRRRDMFASWEWEGPCGVVYTGYPFQFY